MKVTVTAADVFVKDKGFVTVTLASRVSVPPAVALLERGILVSFTFCQG